jgi:hypothetical protein
MPSKVKLIIRNQFPGIELISPMYAGDGVTRHLPLDQSVDVGSTTQAGFDIDLIQGEPIGILMYELKNKKQLNKEAIYSQDETTLAQLYVVWKVNNYKEFCVFSDMIEHDKGRIWDKNKLIKLAMRYKTSNIHTPVRKTYLIRDNTVLMKIVNATREEECHKLEMTIIEGSIDEYTRRPEYIDVNM